MHQLDAWADGQDGMRQGNAYRRLGMGKASGIENDDYLQLGDGASAACATIFSVGCSKIPASKIPYMVGRSKGRTLYMPNTGVADATV